MRAPSTPTDHSSAGDIWLHRQLQIATPHFATRWMSCRCIVPMQLVPAKATLQTMTESLGMRQYTIPLALALYYVEQHREELEARAVKRAAPVAGSGTATVSKWCTGIGVPPAAVMKPESLRQYWPRTTAAAVLLMAGLVAALFRSQWTDVGMQCEGMRAALCGVVAYCTYLVAMAGWLMRFSPLEPKSLLPNKSGSAIGTPRPGESSFDDSFDASVDAAIREASRDARSVLGLLVAAAVFGSLSISLHFIYHTPCYLGQLLVDGGKIRHRALPVGKSLDVLVLPFLQSWPVALILLLHDTLIGFVIDLRL